MHQHALRTAVRLYGEGTWTRETAANHAGVSGDRIERAARRYGLEVAERAAEAPETVRVAAD